MAAKAVSTGNGKQTHARQQAVAHQTSNRKKTLPRSSAVQKRVQAVQIESREGAVMMGGAAVMERVAWIVAASLQKVQRVPGCLTKRLYLHGAEEGTNEPIGEEEAPR